MNISNAVAVLGVGARFTFDSFNSLSMFEKIKAVAGLAILGYVAYLATELQKTKKSPALGEKVKGLESRIETLNLELVNATQREAQATQREAQATQRADTLMGRLGKSHVNRDWQQSCMELEFPNGEAIREEFILTFLSAESFACDIITTLRECCNLEEPEASKALINDVLKPLYEGCENFVENRLSIYKDSFKQLSPDGLESIGIEGNLNSMFWYANMQSKFSVLSTISDDQVDEIMNERGRLQEVHKEMLRAEKEDRISLRDENNMSLPVLARKLVRLMMLVELSFPRCYVSKFFPEESLKYHRSEGLAQDFMQEILSPGVKKHGRIKEGDPVEVVFPGLYFEDKERTPITTDTKPVVPALVRRVNPSPVKTQIVAPVLNSSQKNRG